MRCEHLTPGGLICVDPDRPGAPSVCWCEDRPECPRDRTPLVRARMLERDRAQRATEGQKARKTQFDDRHPDR